MKKYSPGPFKIPFIKTKLHHMLNYLRKKRKKLIAKGNLKNYLAFASGALLLVMVGILLALQVNNWHERRKTGIQELETLKELRSDLVLNLSDIEENIIDLDECVKSNEIILFCIDNKKPSAWIPGR
jgi:hypothetical protein